MKISVKMVGIADFRVQRLCGIRRNFVPIKSRIHAILEWHYVLLKSFCSSKKLNYNDRQPTG